MKNRAQCKTGAYGPQGGGMGVVRGDACLAAGGLAVVAERVQVLAVSPSQAPSFCKVSACFLRDYLTDYPISNTGNPLLPVILG